MGVRQTVSVLVAGAALLASSGITLAQDYALCVKLEARLVELERGQSGGAMAALKRQNTQIVEQQRMLAVARQQAQRAGCGPQTGFLFFRPPRPTGCAEHDATVKRLEASVARLQDERRTVAPAGTGRNEAERRRILAMLGDNHCGPQYERYASRSNSGLFGFFFRDYTRDPYMTEPGGLDLYGTYRTLCVRTCDGFFWPVSFSTVQSHFDIDEQVCNASCPNTEVALYIHRNPGETPEEAISLAGQPISQMPNAFRYRNEYVGDCSCKARMQTAALAERVVIDIAARGGALSPDAEDEAGGAAAPQSSVIPLPRNRPGNEPPVAGSIATVTGMEDYQAVPTPTVSLVAGRSVRVVGPGFTLYRSSGE